MNRVYICKCGNSLIVESTAYTAESELAALQPCSACMGRLRERVRAEVEGENRAISTVIDWLFDQNGTILLSRHDWTEGHAVILDGGGRAYSSGYRLAWQVALCNALLAGDQAGFEGEHNTGVSVPDNVLQAAKEVCSD